MLSTAFARCLNRYGETVHICHGGEEPGTTGHAFVQPVREKRDQEIPTPLGRARVERFLYLGEPDVPLENMGGGYVIWRGRRFEVQCAQPIYVGRQLTHWWAVLLPRDGEAMT